MISNEQKIKLLEAIIDKLDLPDSAYQKAENRYKDIGEWLIRKESVCKDNKPHIFPQGSFRLGTAIKPLNEKEEYDLDLACSLCEGITKSTHTQSALKILMGKEIESYRLAKGIKSEKEEKHRCWCLKYSDSLSFHIDIIPCIPSDETTRQNISESMMKVGEDKTIAENVSQFTVSITDDRHPKYRQICDDWKISNPEGYAKWFESRMRKAGQLLIEKASIHKVSTIDELPTYKWKTPLQKCIQILKRHRDRMFKNDLDIKPISIIITTLAARAYKGESDTNSALQNILENMGSYVKYHKPRIPNPVDPNEDFADRWSMTEYSDLNLENNFWSWLRQAKNDFDLLCTNNDMNFVSEQAKQKLSLNLNADDLMEQLGLSVSSISVVTPKLHTSINPTKPWLNKKHEI